MLTIEVGCYADAINLSVETEPDIFQALRFGAVLENVYLEDDHEEVFTDTGITEKFPGNGFRGNLFDKPRRSHLT